jgi:DNA repair exonuclease SbcCD nuclease subunit
MAVTILVSGDLHLGRRSKHLPADLSADISSPIQTWRRVIDEAVRREVDLVCLTGDVVDEDNKYFEAFGPLVQELRRLEEHGIPAYLVAGNHDYDVLGELVAQVETPNVHLLGRNGSWETVTFEHPEQPLAITGWSFPSRHHYRNPLVDFSTEAAAATVTIGLLHCDLDGTEDRYAPVPRSDLERAPVDCWLLGHIHRPSLHEDEIPLLYTGSPHALDSGEEGRHGPWLVTVHSSHKIDIEQLPISPVRYDTVSVDLAAVETREEWRAAIVSALAEHLDSLNEELRATELVMCDVILEGRTSAYEAMSRSIAGEEVEDLVYEAYGTKARIRKIRNDARPAVGNLEELAAQDNPAGYLARIVCAIEEDDDSELVDELVRRLRPVFRRVDRSSTYAPLHGEASLDRSDAAITEQILERSRELLAALVDQKA